VTDGTGALRQRASADFEDTPWQHLPRDNPPRDVICGGAKWAYQYLRRIRASVNPMRLAWRVVAVRG